MTANPSRVAVAQNRLLFVNKPFFFVGNDVFCTQSKPLRSKNLPAYESLVWPSSPFHWNATQLAAVLLQAEKQASF